MKTLAIRLEDDVHARLTILAKLAGQPVTDVLRHAVEAHIATMAADPSLSAQAERLAAEIEREASEQRAALAGLFGPGSTSTGKPSSPRPKAS